jgi:hypothetical protein
MTMRMIHAVVSLVIYLCFSVVSSLALSTSPRPTTIAVCTGLDCRIDGASDCLRQLAQRAVPVGIKVTGRPCLGPCGDGPNVLVLDAHGKRVVQKQENRIQGSLVPPELFGSDPRGVYQVRTYRNLEQVLQIAADTAGLLPPPSQEVPTTDKDHVVIVSTRQPLDRPLNERLVLQRLMQFLVLVGLYEYEYDNVIGTEQVEIAVFLFLLSNFIMKENLFTWAWKRIGKKSRRRG